LKQREKSKPVKKPPNSTNQAVSPASRPPLRVISNNKLYAAKLTSNKKKDLSK
jgi:hypothetical protein